VILGASSRVRVFVYREPVDMRKAYDTLSALVVEPMKKSLLSGDVFVFIGRTRNQAT
jgi:transposase